MATMTKAAREELKAQVHDLALAYRTHQQAEKAERDAKQETGRAVHELMGRLKLGVLEVGGLRIFAKSSKRTITLARARTRLKASVVKLIIREEVDMKAWAAQKRAGVITAADDVACLEVVDVEPYLIVNDVNRAG